MQTQMLDADVMVEPSPQQLMHETLRAVHRMLGPLPWGSCPTLVTTLPQLARAAGWSTRQTLFALVLLHEAEVVGDGSLIPADEYVSRKGTVVVVLRL